MFRYERPQKGRLRQFHQVGVELLGIADPLADVEVIALASDLLAALGLAGRVTLEINTLGDAESRSRYRTDLVSYLTEFRDRLSGDSQIRLEHNPLRILDSKDPGDRAIIAGAPRLVQSLNARSSDYFAQVLAHLDGLGIAARPSDRLVRGLDYYCHTIFEFTTDVLGAQGTVLAGGRYDGLVEQMGGPSVPGTGWAAGVERLMLLADDVPAAPRPIAIMPLGSEQAGAALAVARRLRAAGQPVVFGFGGSLKKQMAWANRIAARVVVILGSEEVARQVAAVRDMDTGRQEDIPLVGIEDHPVVRPM
jgi:histidyl-tRNA synthetase